MQFVAQFVNFISCGAPSVMATVDVDVSVSPEPLVDDFLDATMSWGDETFGDGDFKTGFKPVIELYKKGEMLEKFSRDELTLLDKKAMDFYFKPGDSDDERNLDAKFVATKNQLLYYFKCAIGHRFLKEDYMNMSLKISELLKLELVITVKDFRTPEGRVFNQAFKIKADGQKSPSTMYVEGICDNQRFNIIRKIADVDEWKAMWFHGGKPLNHPFNSLESEGVKDGDEIEVHLVKAGDERFELFHKEACEKAKKMIDEVEKPPPLADVPASSNQPPEPLAPVVPLQNFGEMSLEEMEAMMVRLKEGISDKKKRQ
eukprot:s462_g54.t1